LEAECKFLVRAPGMSVGSSVCCPPSTVFSARFGLKETFPRAHKSIITFVFIVVLISFVSFVSHSLGSLGPWGIAEAV